MRNGKSETVCAVDFGSRDVRAVIARREEGGSVHVLGHGTAPGRGCVSQGVIQDLNAAKVALGKALSDAEREARVSVSSVFCGINGRNVETFIREANVKIEREVVELSHMDEALDIASRDVLEAGKRIISSIAAQEWYVDDMRVIDPAGIRGQVLKARVHFARFPAVIEDNIVHCIESQRKELEDIIYLPLAASIGCLTPEDMELGVGVLDLGRTTTGIAVFRDRRILGTHSFDWGGYHLTRDVAAGLHVSFEEADELVLEYGICEEYIAEDSQELLEVVGGTRPVGRDPQLKLKTSVHGAASVVDRGTLDMIVYERANELMTKVRQYLNSRGLMPHLVRGLVLTGGGSAIRNYVALAETMFQVPCRIGIPNSIEAAPPRVKEAPFSAVIGIAQHGFDYRAATRSGHLGGRGPVRTSLRKFGRAFQKYFF